MRVCPVCREVRIAVRGHVPPSYPVFFKVEAIGQEVPSLGRVVYARPSPPCIVTPATKIVFVRSCTVKVRELEKNVLLTLRYDDGDVKHYIYPKQVWEVVYDKYLEKMARGEPPHEPGLLLYGPRGTGKSSMISILADVLGLYRVKIDTSILSKYVGESEERLRSRFAEAEANEPSLVDMDEQDYLVRRRDLVGTSGNVTDGAALTQSSILSILLNKLPEYKKQRRSILVVLATNLSPSLIDDALLRHERFGKPVFVPLPDYEAIKTMLTLSKIEKIVDAKELERLAAQLAAVGITMADLIDLIDEIREKKKIPDLKKLSKFERGYRRPYPAKLSDIPNDVLQEVLPYTKGRARVMVPCQDFELAEAIIVMLLSRVGVPTVVLTDVRHFDEAVVTAESCEGVLVVPSDYIPQDVQTHIYLNAKCPVFYIYGRQTPPVSAQQLNIVHLLELKLKKRGILQIVCDYYGIDYTEQDLKKLAEDVRYVAYTLHTITKREVRSLSEIVQELRKKLAVL